MNTADAREILLRYRPGTADEQDPEVRTALELASRDPELAEWLDSHREFQREMRRTFGSLQVPAGLREQILSEKPLRTRRWSVPARLLVGAMATLVLLFGLTVWLGRDVQPDDRLANFRFRMVKTALRGYAMDLESQDPARVQSYLETRKAPSDWQVPPGVERWPLLGCAVLTWQNQPTTMLCYGRSGEPELWLFVVDRQAIRDAPTGSGRVIRELNRLATVTWTRDGRTYLLAGRMPVARLLELVADKT